MNKGPSHIELAYSSIAVFADDGKLDLAELNFLLGIALRDNHIDDNERAVLKSIFERLTPSEMSAQVRRRIQEVSQQHNL